jgi:hypothetical protein
LGEFSPIGRWGFFLGGGEAVFWKLQK